MERKKWWTASISFSLLCLMLIGGIWLNAITKEEEPSSHQPPLKNAIDVRNFIGDHFPDSSVETIPTGVFIQSLKFNSSTEVNFTGYIWQTLDLSYTSKYDNPEDIPVGFVLPEAVESGNNDGAMYAYRQKKDNGKEVIGWYFEATLKQPFHYSKYPFDHKTAWIRIWPRDFGDDKLLVPDFKGYTSTDVNNGDFGYDKEIVLGQWDLERTYFNYQSKDYNTNFGFFKNDDRSPHPELYFNLVIKRKFINSFVVYILPLVIIAGLTFATLMMITNDPEKEAKLGMNTSGVIGVCSGLFFVVLLSQVQIREQFAGSGIVYIESFYPLMYGALLGVSINSYLFSTPNDGSNRILRWIHHDDNIHSKLLFWPLLLGSATMITACVLLPEPKQNNQDQAEIEVPQSFFWAGQNADRSPEFPLIWDSVQSEALDFQTIVSLVPFQVEADNNEPQGIFIV